MEGDYGTQPNTFYMGVRITTSLSLGFEKERRCFHNKNQWHLGALFLPLWNRWCGHECWGWNEPLTMTWSSVIWCPLPRDSFQPFQGYPENWSNAIRLATVNGLGRPMRCDTARLRCAFARVTVVALIWFFKGRKSTRAVQPTLRRPHRSRKRAAPLLGSLKVASDDITGFLIAV